MRHQRTRHVIKAAQMLQVLLHLVTMLAGEELRGAGAPAEQ